VEFELHRRGCGRQDGGSHEWEQCQHCVLIDKSCRE
jgi:hypothetical protein